MMSYTQQRHNSQIWETLIVPAIAKIYISFYILFYEDVLLESRVFISYTLDLIQQEFPY